MNFLLPNKGAFKTTDNTILGASFEMTPYFQAPMAMKEWYDNLNYKMKTLQERRKTKSHFRTTHFV